MKKGNGQKGYITIGILFLVAGLAMLLAEYSTDATLDVPDVYAGSELSDTTAISSTCSPTGNVFSAPTNVAFGAVFTSTTGGLTAEAAPTLTIGGPITCAECATDTIAFIGTALTTDQEGADNGSYYSILANAFRSNRNVQCLGMGIPYSEMQMNVATLPAGILNISVENAANASQIPSFTALTTTLAYVIGNSGTANAVYVDNAVAELTIGGSANMVSGFGWSILIQRNIGIGLASALSDSTLQIQSELGIAQ